MTLYFFQSLLHELHKNLVRCHSFGMVSKTFHALLPIPNHPSSRSEACPVRYVAVLASGEALVEHCDIGVSVHGTFRSVKILRKDLSTSSRCFWLVLFLNAACFFRSSEQLATLHNQTSSFFHNVCLFDNCSDQCFFLGNLQEVALRHPITPC